MQIYTYLHTLSLHDALPIACRHYSTYLNNMFTAAQLARFQQQETPFYCYDTGLHRETVNDCKLAAGKRDFHVHYALKANKSEEHKSELHSLMRISYPVFCLK